jgi:hypothetical protein
VDSTLHLYTHYIANDSCACEYFKTHNKVHRGESSHNFGLQNLWRMIWGMNVPNSVKMFIWRAYHNILPTKENLQKKGIALDLLICYVYSTTSSWKWFEMSFGTAPRLLMYGALAALKCSRVVWQALPLQRC